MPSRMGCRRSHCRVGVDHQRDYYSDASQNQPNLVISLIHNLVSCVRFSLTHFAPIQMDYRQLSSASVPDSLTNSTIDLMSLSRVPVVPVNSMRRRSLD